MQLELCVIGVSVERPLASIDCKVSACPGSARICPGERPLVDGPVGHEHIGDSNNCLIKTSQRAVHMPYFVWVATHSLGCVIGGWPPAGIVVCLVEDSGVSLEGWRMTHWRQ